MSVFSVARTIVTIIGFVAFSLTGCSSGSGSLDSPESCCEAGSQVCQDGVLLICDAAAEGTLADESGVIAGFDLQMTPCPSGACSGNDCASKQCSGPVGSTYCRADGKVVTCSASGTEKETTCANGETCLGGACVAVPCVAGELLCSGSDLMECSESGVYETKERCGDAGKSCSSLTKGCAAPQCGASERLCYGGNVIVCDQNGFVDNEFSCTEGEECRSGHCIPSICGGVPVMTDASGSADVGKPSGANDIAPPPEVFTIQDVVSSKPDVKAPSLASAVLDGEKVIFSSYKTAAWISTGTQDNPDQGKALQVSMVKGVTKVELLITGLQEGQVGEWDDKDKSVVQVEARYSDGITEAADPQAAGCTTVGWTSCSQTYRIELTAFGTVGQHVKGNFEVGLVDGTVFTEGAFDVERIQ